MSDGFDTRLRSVEHVAASAIQQISSHEEVCAERYSHINKSIDGMRIFLTRAVLSIMGAMSIIIGFLIVDRFFK